jgi:hypothetical protein
MLPKVTRHLRDIPGRACRGVREPVHARRSGLASIAFVKFDLTCLAAGPICTATLEPSGQDPAVVALD